VEYQLTRCQAGQARADFAAIEDALDFIKAQLERLPTRREITRLILLATVATAAVLLVAILAR
jgi:hypothetical protein